MKYEDFKNKKWNLPERCPACGAELVYTGSRVYCSNPNCKEALVHRIAKWIATLDVKNFGPALIDWLVNSKYVEKLADIYSPTVHSIMKTDWGVNGEKAYRNLLAKKSVSLAQLIGGFDIENVGETLIQTIVNAGYDSIEKINKLTVADLTQINGWSDIRATAFLEGYSEIKSEVEEMATLVDVVQPTENKASFLENIHICITGKLDTLSRKEIEKRIAEVGGVVDKTVTAKTNYLCTNDATSGSSKLKNATKYKTNIITENELIELMGKKK